MVALWYTGVHVALTGQSGGGRGPKLGRFFLWVICLGPMLSSRMDGHGLR
jgi:hypothetical protein